MLIRHFVNFFPEYFHISAKHLNKYVDNRKETMFQNLPKKIDDPAKYLDDKLYLDSSSSVPSGQSWSPSQTQAWDIITVDCESKDQS